MYNEKTYKPVDNMLFVKLDPFVAKAGIILPEGATDHVERSATVLATGRGYNGFNGLIPCNAAVGDRVLVHKASISPLEYLDSEVYGVLKDVHLMGIIVKKPFISIEKAKEKK